MGYYTDYKIDIRRADGMGLDYGVYDEIVEHLNDCTYYKWSHDLEAWEIKWYGHHDEMLGLSRKFPDLVFTLDGVGEEYPDIWRKFYHNGKCVEHRAEIVFPEFNMEDLK